MGASMLYLWNKRKRLHKEIVKLHRIVLAAVSLFWNTMQYRRREVTGNLVLTTPENTITYRNALYLSPPKIQFSWELKWPQEKLKLKLKLKFWGDKQRALWYVMVFLEWSTTVYAYFN